MATLLILCIGQAAEHFVTYTLEEFPAHQHRAWWQFNQFKKMRENLPLGHTLRVMDFSENYSHTVKKRIQSAYFCQVQTSLHISINYRHATEAEDL